MQTKKDQEALAQSVLDMMKQCGVPPTPENFALFHVYAAGENAGLSRVLAPLIAARRPLNPELLSEICERCFSSAQMKMPSDQGSGQPLLDAVAASASSARKEAAGYRRVLALAEQALEQISSDGRVGELVGALGTATKAMEGRLHALDQSLMKAAPLIAELDGALSVSSDRRATDKVSGLGNHLFFAEELSRSIEELAGRDEPVSVIVLRTGSTAAPDSEEFRAQLARLVATDLSRRIGPVLSLAHLGEAEFGFVLRNMGLREAVALAADVGADLASLELVRKSTGERVGFIEPCSGVAQFAEGEDSSDLVRRARECLALAVELGPNTVIAEDDARFAASEIDAA